MLHGVLHHSGPGARSTQPVGCGASRTFQRPEDVAMGFLRRLLGAPAPAPSPRGQHIQAPIFDRSTHSRVQVVGESHYQRALDQAAGGRTDDGPRHRDHVAVLIPEPANPLDPNAVMVQINAEVVGYLSREDAVAYLPVLRVGAALGFPAMGCHASLKGGWDRGGGDIGSYGVVLHLGSPDELMTELRAAGLLPAGIAEEALAAVESAPDGAPPTPVAGPLDLGDLTGKTVCFTGESACSVGGQPLSRATQEALATNAGLHVLPRATKKLDLLVVSPYAGHTGKVAVAERFGILRVDEVTFWRAIGVRID